MAKKPPITTPDTTYKVDSHIPVPAKGKSPTYPFRVMEVGDSFFVPGLVEGARAAATARVSALRIGMKFATRKITEKGFEGYRIWRIE